MQTELTLKTFQQIFLRGTTAAGRKGAEKKRVYLLKDHMLFEKIAMMNMRSIWIVC